MQIGKQLKLLAYCGRNLDLHLEFASTHKCYLNNNKFTFCLAPDRTTEDVIVCALQSLKL